MVPQAERGLSIEAQAGKWASTRREKILGRIPSGAIRVVKKEVQENIFPLPPLAYKDHRQATLHFSRFTGEIFVPIWREIIPSPVEGRLSLGDHLALVQLRRPREHRVDFENLPKRKVVELVLAKTNNLEAAIRQQLHIMDSYQEGKEAQQILTIVDWINFQLEATLKGKLSEDSLKSLAQETAQFLISSGLSSAKLTTKRLIGESLINATRLVKGRINPLVMRVRIRSAYLRAVEREIMPALIGGKFGSFLGILLMEREMTRQTIQGGTEDLDTMVGITKRGAAIFEKTEWKSSEGEKQGMETVLKAVARSLARVRVLPYLPAARMAAINLVGCREKKRELNRGIIGEETDELFFLHPVVKLLQVGNFQDAKEKVRDSYNSLRRVFEENKEIG